MARWRPPHPDPVKPAPTPSTQRRRAEATNSFIRCEWRGCEQDRTILYHDSPLCMIHTQIMQRVFLATEQRISQRGKEREQELAASAEKIEAGERLTSRDPVPGHVYYIRIDGLIKIGYTSNVWKRMQAYPPNAELLALEPGTKKTETDRHAHFRDKLARGREWFGDCSEIRDWITTLREEYGDPSDKAYRYSEPGERRAVIYPRGYSGHRN